MLLLLLLVMCWLLVLVGSPSTSKGPHTTASHPRRLCFTEISLVFLVLVSRRVCLGVLVLVLLGWLVGWLVSLLLPALAA